MKIDSSKKLTSSNDQIKHVIAFNLGHTWCLVKKKKTWYKSKQRIMTSFPKDAEFIVCL
jgi:hypothetical protein